MSTYLDLHIIQSTPSANLNRDDLGTPKTATYGGVLRSRISSQCLKRNIRLRTTDTLTRSRRFHLELAEELTQLHGWDANTAAMAGIDLVDGLTAKRGKSGEAMLFLSRTQIAALIDVALTLGEDAYSKAGTWYGKQTSDKEMTAEKLLTAARTYLNDKKTGVLTHPDNKERLTERDEAITQRDLNVGVFGRMLAELPGARVDAALSVAHALSTHGTEIDLDYYTAVDDLDGFAGDSGAGAGHIGTSELTAAVYYRYTRLNISELAEIAEGNHAAVQEITTAVTNAVVNAFPTGKESSTAAANPPVLVYAVVRDDQPVNLAAAYETPIKPDPNNGGFITPSIVALADTIHGYDEYGYNTGIRFRGHASLLDTTPHNTHNSLGDKHTITGLIDHAVTAATQDTR